MHRPTNGTCSRRSRLAQARPAQLARIRLFVFLGLLAPLFVVLQAVVGDGRPRIEFRFVPRDVPAEVPVDVVIERIVNRVVYAPVPRAGLRPWTGLPWDVSSLPQAWIWPVSC